MSCYPLILVLMAFAAGTFLIGTASYALAVERYLKMFVELRGDDVGIPEDRRNDWVNENLRPNVFSWLDQLYEWNAIDERQTIPALEAARRTQSRRALIAFPTICATWLLMITTAIMLDC